MPMSGRAAHFASKEDLVLAYLQARHEGWLHLYHRRLAAATDARAGIVAVYGASIDHAEMALPARFPRLVDSSMRRPNCLRARRAGRSCAGTRRRSRRSSLPTSPTSARCAPQRGGAAG